MEEGERMVSILSFMGNTRRSGSSPCKSLCSLSHSSEMIGTLYLIPVYPELVALIGWNVPNYQGVFLRGYGGQTSYHYGAVGHWSAGLGELQGDTIRNITGDIESVLNRGGYHSGSGVYSGFVSGVDYLFTTELGGDEGSEFIGRVHFDASRVAPVAQEIRPVNRAVRYLIRAR